MATLAELLEPVTEDEAETTVLALLEAVGFPATSWQPFSVPRTFVKLFSKLYADARSGVTSIVKSRLLDLSEGLALTYLALYLYQVERAEATPTIGSFVLTDDGGAPYDIEVGQLSVQHDATGLLFTNTTAGTLASSGTLTLTFQAEQTGAAYNIATGTALSFAETLEGVLVTNPQVGVTGTWITTPGTDEQTDASLREECRNKWATVGAGTADAYEAWAIEGDPTITKVRVLSPPDEADGMVRVLLATDAGDASATQVANADAVIQAKRPLGLRAVTVLSADATVFTITATVNVFSGASSYMGSLATALQEFQTDIQIGQDIWYSGIDALLHSPGNVRNAVFTLSPADPDPIVADADMIAVFVLGTITVNTVVR